MILCYQKKPQHMVLTGQSGSGKTLMLTEGLKMKVADYKYQGILFKVIIATYDMGGVCLQLHQDMRKKYSLDYVMKEFEIEIKNIVQRYIYELEYRVTQIKVCYFKWL